MSPSNAGGPLTSPHQELNVSNGGGHTGGVDDANWQSGGVGDVPQSRDRSKSPSAREGGGRRDRGSVPCFIHSND